LSLLLCLLFNPNQLLEGFSVFLKGLHLLFILPNLVSQKLLGVLQNLKLSISVFSSVRSFHVRRASMMPSHHRRNLLFSLVHNLVLLGFESVQRDVDLSSFIDLHHELDEQRTLDQMVEVHTHLVQLQAFF